MCRVTLEVTPTTTAQLVSVAAPGQLHVSLSDSTAGQARVAAAARSRSALSPPVSSRGTPVPLPRAVSLPKGLVVAIDAGHGGSDPGAVNAALGLHEKTVALDVAHRVRARLEAAGCRVIMSRTGDERLQPSQRLDWLSDLQADVLVSIHCDSIEGRDDWEGATTYFHGGSEPARSLAQAVQLALVRATGAPDLGVRADTSRYDTGFYLLRNARQPAVLVETGYISNPETARRFQDPDYRQQLAAGIAAGIQAYLKGSALREAKR